MEEQPTDKVYMWLVILTTIAFAVAITFGMLAIKQYKSGYEIQQENPYRQ